MNLALTKPVLLVHYAPGMLVVLRQRSCQNHYAHPERAESCPPNFTIAEPPYLLQDDEQGWCLERSWIPK